MLSRTEKGAKGGALEEGEAETEKPPQDTESEQQP